MRCAVRMLRSPHCLFLSCLCVQPAGGVSVGFAMIMAGFAAAKSIALFAPAFALGELGM